MASSETCSACGQEVRWGWRHGREAYWHREDVDHEPVFGRVFTAADAAEVERQMHLPRTRLDADGNEVAYTAAQWERERMNKSKRAVLAAEEAGDDDEEEGHDELEPVEVRCIPLPDRGRVFIGFPDSPPACAVVPGGARTLLNLAAKMGWDVLRLTYARGPYLGASGKSLGVSDSVVMSLRGPVVDNCPRRAIAFWRDGKSTGAWLIEDRKITRVGARALSAWMKEAPRGQSA